MEEKITGISDGVYTLQESEKDNEFFFFRNDGEILTKLDHEPMELYQAYIMKKMMNGEIEGMVINNLCFEKSDDGKIIRITIADEAENTKEVDNVAENIEETDNATDEVLYDFVIRVKRKPRFWERLRQKLFKHNPREATVPEDGNTKATKYVSPFSSKKQERAFFKESQKVMFGKDNK